jgi:hypothetical protein
VTLVAALGGLGALETGAANAGPIARDSSYHSPASPRSTPPATSDATPSQDAQDTTTQPSSTDTTAPLGSGRASAQTLTTLPASSGSGRRVVFSQHLQRVWLVGAHQNVERTYLVSGSTSDNLQPGTYAITNRERHAIGIDNSGTMQFFDIFTAGPTGAAIGFHSIPVKDGHLVQTMGQLGTPQSHGCIRQWKPDAIALWKFAPIGTKVVVVA